jgi:hypothetical protein
MNFEKLVNEKTAELTEAAEVKSWTHGGWGYTIPKEIVDLSNKGKIEDTSYKNDMMPSFGIGEVDTSNDRHTYTVWVDHIDPESRETDSDRFMIVKNDGDDRDIVLQSENLKDVLKKIKSLI